jgi:hypothetical protein
VALGADVHRAETEGRLLRVLNLMDSVAVSAHGDVGVTFAQKSAAVDAFRILVVDRVVTGSAPLRYSSPGLIRWGDIVGAVAVGAGGSLLVTLREHRVVHTVQGLRVVIEVATAAHLVVAKHVIAVIRHLEQGVRVMRMSRVTGVATQAAAVGRFLEDLGIHIERKPFAAGEGDAQAGVAVAV